LCDTIVQISVSKLQKFGKYYR